MSCIALDFDDTVAYWNDPGYRGLYEIFVRRGIPRELVHECYEETKRTTGFSPLNLCIAIARRGFTLQKEAIEREIDEWRRRTLVVFDDGRRAINEWRERGTTVVIVTAGDPDYQLKKIQEATIPYDAHYSLRRANEKASALRALLEQYGKPVIFYDDKATELDAIRRKGLSVSQVITVWVRRPTGRYSHIHARYPHIEVALLTDSILAPR